MWITDELPNNQLLERDISLELAYLRDDIDRIADASRNG
jgi:hypothetical protein